MKREDALIIAEGLVVTDIASPEEIADAIFNAWSEGFSDGEREGYAEGYASGYTDGFTDEGKVMKC